MIFVLRALAGATRIGQICFYTIKTLPRALARGCVRKQNQPQGFTNSPKTHALARGLYKQAKSFS